LPRGNAPLLPTRAHPARSGGAQVRFHPHLDGGERLRRHAERRVLRSDRWGSEALGELRGPSSMRSSIDHLAVAVTSLEDRQLDELLGVKLSPGGQHARMGTHNRLLRLGPTSYLELIAIDPGAPAPAHPRWFELDEPAMKARLGDGPRLVHWV